MKTIAEALEEKRLKDENGPWVPACGGTEKPFIVNGRRLQYLWQPSTGKHAYIDLDVDIFLTEMEVSYLFNY